jgi:hypothetical protein
MKIKKKHFITSYIPIGHIKMQKIVKNSTIAGELKKKNQL